MFDAIINYFRKPEIPESLRDLEQNRHEFVNYICSLQDKYNAFKFRVGSSNCSVIEFDDILTQKLMYKNSNYLFFFCYYSPWFSRFRRFEKYVLNYKRCIDGYSPISAIIMSHDETVIDKRIYIQRIMKYNIVPTEKDLGVNNLILYNCISFSMREIMVSLLCDNKILLIDIRKFIINMWIKCLRYEYCPLF